ncbi:type II secretion system F family protein [Hansschlegelia zhihuaiae]|uniref:Type II secretion system F family protein n=1 Tax=Hansschlegelia zhihuaiae TaxID=405005 RepID=A0A4Q0MAK5_9HYPH|nr:type II secretion system F family protein [Hansschlegelia zhihuaiae]RXF70287.1 type II secretion system F family protein [Hansschlegelia zhihuaiae]
MATFEYRAINPAGKMVSGAMEGASRADVLAELNRSGFTPISAAETAGAAKRSWRERLTPEPSAEHITGFTLDLAMLLKGGVPLNQALAILTEMESRRWLVKLIEALHGEIAGGKSFSQALALHPRLFPPVYVQTVAVAETAGRLEEALSDIAQERQRNERLRKSFTSAIAYPGFLAVAAIGVMSFVLLFVIPQFEGALQGFRSKLSPSTTFVFDLSRWFRDNINVIVLSVAGVLLLLLVLSRVGRGGNLIVRGLARMPLTRTLLSHELTVTFCRTLSILLTNGVPITIALRLIRDIVRVPSAAAAIDLAMADVRQGQRLSEALARRAFLPAHVTQMLRVGEEAGKLPDSAARIAGFYETKLETSLKRLVAVIGPVMMIAVACLVAWLIVSVMTALTSINDLLV